MTSKTYTLAEAAKARHVLIEEFQSLLHVAVLDLLDEGGEISVALEEIAKRPGREETRDGSHDTRAFRVFAEALVDRALACPEDIMLDLGPHHTETKETL